MDHGERNAAWRKVRPNMGGNTKWRVQAACGLAYEVRALCSHVAHVVWRMWHALAQVNSLCAHWRKCMPILVLMLKLGVERAQVVDLRVVDAVQASPWHRSWSVQVERIRVILRSWDHLDAMPEQPRSVVPRGVRRVVPLVSRTYRGKVVVLCILMRLGIVVMAVMVVMVRIVAMMAS